MLCHLKDVFTHAYGHKLYSFYFYVLTFFYSIVSLVSPISTIDVYRGITQYLTDPLKREIQSTDNTWDDARTTDSCQHKSVTCVTKISLDEHCIKTVTEFVLYA